MVIFQGEGEVVKTGTYADRIGYVRFSLPNQKEKLAVENDTAKINDIK